MSENFETRVRRAKTTPSSNTGSFATKTNAETDAPLAPEVPSVRWCGNDAEHPAHRERNQFGGFNECTGISAGAVARTAARDAALAPGAEQHTCECGASFVSFDDLNEHQWSKRHGEFGSEDDYDEASVFDDGLVCRFCGGVFSNPDEAEEHEKIHSNDPIETTQTEGGYFQARRGNYLTGLYDTADEASAVIERLSRIDGPENDPDPLAEARAEAAAEKVYAASDEPALTDESRARVQAAVAAKKASERLAAKEPRTCFCGEPVAAQTGVSWDIVCGNWPACTPDYMEIERQAGREADAADAARRAAGRGYEVDPDVKRTGDMFAALRNGRIERERAAEAAAEPVSREQATRDYWAGGFTQASSLPGYLLARGAVETETQIGRLRKANPMYGDHYLYDTADGLRTIKIEDTGYSGQLSVSEAFHPADPPSSGWHERGTLWAPGHGPAQTGARGDQGLYSYTNAHGTFFAGTTIESAAEALARSTRPVAADRDVEGEYTAGQAKWAATSLLSVDARFGDRFLDDDARSTLERFRDGRPVRADTLHAALSQVFTKAGWMRDQEGGPFDRAGRLATYIDNLD